VNNFTHARPELLLPLTDWCRSSATLDRPLIQGRPKTPKSRRLNPESRLIKPNKGFLQKNPSLDQGTPTPDATM
jgi:hypothetical protein